MLIGLCELNSSSPWKLLIEAHADMWCTAGNRNVTYIGVLKDASIHSKLS